MARIMVDVETAPEVGVPFDDYVTTVFDAADEAWHGLRHYCEAEVTE
jgi:hypothetical protein